MSTVAIKVNGTDITDDVMIREASFQSLVNGALGQASFRVKDVNQTYDFNSGDSLTLDIDGVRSWGGYVMQAKKVYALPVIDSSPPGEVTRVWRVMGLDYNVLFNKRIVFKESAPTGKISFEYDASTYDDTIINDIFDHYLTLSGDGLTRTGVTRIAKAILDVPGRSHSGIIASAGFTWKQMMDSVQRATGGVYYINPDKDLNYVDAETVTSDYTLTDVPSGAFDCGYQAFSLLQDGTNLVNDMRIWGAGTGSTGYVYSRSQDAASIAAHGRWQQALVTSGLFRQASADIVAHSYVYGTPQSHRGGKDDALVFNARVFRPVFRAGDIVAIECGVYGYTDTLPLRSMTITFAGPTKPIFDLVLTHAIDQAVSIYEFMDINLNSHLPPLPGIDGVTPPPPVPPVGGCDCGITDAFERTVADGWGTSDSTLPWTGPWYRNAGSASVNGTQGVIATSSGGLEMAIPYSGWTGEATVLIGGWGSTPTDELADISFLQTLNAVSGSRGHYLVAYIDNDSGGTASLFIEDDGSGFAGYTLPTLTASVYLKVSLTATTFSAKAWNSGDPEPSSYQVTFATAHPISDYTAFTLRADNEGKTFDNLDIPAVTRCTAAQFEAWNRTIAPGSTWGVSTDGHPWVANFIDASTKVSVTSGQAKIDITSASHINDGAVMECFGPGPWTTPGGFVMSGWFRFENTGGVHPNMRWPGIEGFGLGFDEWVFDGTDVFDYQSSGEVGGTTPTPFVIAADTTYHYRWSYRSDLSVPFVGGDPFSGLNDLYLTDGTNEWTFHGFATVMNQPSNFLILLTRVPSATVNWDMIVGPIDFDYEGRPCFPDCAASVFQDDFNRTVAAGNWGAITPSGDYIWTSGGTASTLSVNGTQAVFTVSTSSFVQFGNPYIGVTPGMKAPWVNPPGNIVTVRYVFQISSIGASTSDYGFIGAAFGYNGGSQEAFAGVEIRSGPGSGGNAYASGFTNDDTVFNAVWSANVDYNMVIEYEAGVAIRMKYWLASAAEPVGWIVEGDDTGAALIDGTYDSYFTCSLAGRTSKTIKVQSITFDGLGDCEACTETVIDDFNDRTIAANTNTPSAIGDTSGTGDPWVNMNFAGASATYAIEDGVMKLRVVRPTSGYEAGFLSLNNGGTAVFPYVLAGAGFPAELITGDQIDFQFDFMVDNLATFTDIEFWLADGYTSNYEGIEGGLNLFGGHIGIDSYSAFGTTPAFTFAANTWYTVRVQASNGVAKLKVWATGSPEPDQWNQSVECLAPPWPSPGELSLQARAYGPTGSGTTVTFSFDNFLYRTCTPSSSETTSGVPAEGRVCETIANPSGGDTFQTSNAFFSGTLNEVYVNGIQQIGVTSNGGADGMFFLADPITSTDVLYVCYNANGAVVV